MCCLLRLCLGDEGRSGFGLGQLEVQESEGVGKNLVRGVSVVINRVECRIMRVEETGGFLRFVCKG